MTRGQQVSLVAEIDVPSSAVGNTLNTEEWCKQKGKCEIQILYSSASKVCCWGKDINIVPGKHCFQYHYAPLWSLFRLAFINGPCFYLHFNRKAVCVCVCVFINYTHTHHGSYAVLGCKKKLECFSEKSPCLLVILHKSWGFTKRGLLKVTCNSYS